jgi:CRP/FNR family transcriptional regulator
MIERQLKKRAQLCHEFMDIRNAAGGRAVSTASAGYFKVMRINLDPGQMSQWVRYDDPPSEFTVIVNYSTVAQIAPRNPMSPSANAETNAAQARHCHHDFQVSCSNCRLSQICLPIALETADIEKLDSIIQRGRPLQKGEHVYRQNDTFKAVYAVRSGTLKSYSTSDSGEEQVTAFHFPGEILGLDGIGKNRYLSSAVALDTAAICEIPFELLGDLSIRIPSLQRHFLQLMSREIGEDQQLITMLSKSSAEQRVAALLLSISARNVRRKLSATAFRLSMSRSDIGNYLGLTVETVSRIFSRFQKTGLIKADGKEVAIIDAARLRETADGVANY